MVVKQQDLKINKEILDVEQKERNLLQNIKIFNTRFDILSSKLFEKKQNREIEEFQCREVHAKMTERLKQNQLFVFKLHDEIHSLSYEIEALKKTVVDCHRDALSWETKWKMTIEAKRNRNEELNKAGDIGIMKSEIHRMEVRFAQLRRAQEKLVHDMENCVQHREQIFNGSSVRSKLHEIKPSRIVNTKQYKINEMKAKLKTAFSHLATVEKQIEKVNEEKEYLEVELKKINETIQDERLQLILLQDEIDQTTILKQEVNIIHICLLFIYLFYFIIYRIWIGLSIFNVEQSDIII